MIFSRLVPGARLPTYLAAGFLRVPLARFLFVTGSASCAWTLAILFLAQTFGAKLATWLGIYKHAGLILVGAGVVSFAALQLGIFYYRFPHETRGHIFAITEEIFPKLIGDGRHTLGELTTCMHRSDSATVSYTEITVSSRAATMRYHVGAPCANSTSSRERFA